MKVQTLDGIEYEWKIPYKIIQGNKRKTSFDHEGAKIILEQLYPNFQIYEEIPIRVINKKTLYIDLYIKQLNLALEVHGQQHYAFSSLFHKTKLDFINQQRNDRFKTEWCDLNGINLLVLDNKETRLWKDQIKNYEY